MSADRSPIDDYLDDLLPRLRGRPAEVRRLLAEAEDHLRSSAGDAVAEGLDPVAAERRAVERFGSARLVARRFGPGWGRAELPVVARQGVAALAMVFAVGLVAIGISGLVAGAMGGLWGKAFVAGDPSGVAYTPARCADFLEYFPHAGSCEAAAVDHHYEEIVDYRLAAGVLGLLGFAVAGARHRRRRRRDAASGGPVLEERVLPPAFVPSVGAALFGCAAALLLLDGGNLLVQGASHGAGGQLSGALVSGIVGLAFTWRLVGVLTRRAEPAPG